MFEEISLSFESSFCTLFLLFECDSLLLTLPVDVSIIIFELVAIVFSCDPKLPPRHHPLPAVDVAKPPLTFFEFREDFDKFMFEE